MKGTGNEWQNVADILPLARLLGGTPRFYIRDDRLRHILATRIGPPGFYKGIHSFHSIWSRPEYNML